MEPTMTGALNGANTVFITSQTPVRSYDVAHCAALLTPRRYVHGADAGGLRLSYREALEIGRSRPSMRLFLSGNSELHDLGGP